MAQRTIQRRVGAGFAVLLSLLAVTSVVTVERISSLNELAVKAREANSGSQFMLEKQVDHLVWMNALQKSLLSQTEFKGELDPRNCKFGKWLYGAAEEQAKTDRALAAQLETIKQPHVRLHE